MKIALAIVLIYLYASIPFSLLIGFLYKKDIRKEGSGNVGGSNLGRSCGKMAFVYGFVLDLSKGSFAVLIGNLFNINPLYLFLFALLGHALPLFNKFKGGKGVATGFGFVLAYTFWPAIMAISVFLIILYVSRYVSVSAVLAIFTYFLYSLFFQEQLLLKVVMFIVFASVTWLHRKNIKRIKNKTEPKITWMGRK